MGTPSARSIAYQPSLDGLRAIAVVAVLLYHSDFAAARGGFLGVSVFFTLSGYLITSLLLGEQARTGRIAPGRFWARRFRRLAPASLAAIALVVATARWWATTSQEQSLVGDAWAALALVANWRFVVADQSYAELFNADPSTLLHFWSLAVEQQVYLVYPIVMMGVLAVARRRRWLTPTLLSALAGASLVSLVLTGDRDVAYYGTHTRAAEFLVGALLATVPASWLGAVELRRRLVAVGWVALGGLGVLVATTDQQVGWLYRGGFPVLGLVWSALIAGALVPGSLRSTLSWRPLVAVGAVSYGVYLYHWPVYLALDPDRVGVDGPALFAVRVAVTAGLAIASYRWLERPVRERRWLTRPTVAGVAYVGGIAVVAVSVALLPWREPAPSYADAPDQVVEFQTVGSGGAASAVGDDVTATPGTDAASKPDPLRLLLLGGDPQGRERFERLATTHDLELVDRTAPGCPVVHDLLELPDAVPLPPGCLPASALAEQVAATAAEEPVDVIVVLVGAPDVAVLDAVRTSGLSADDVYVRVTEIRRRRLEDLAGLGGGDLESPPVLFADRGIDELVSDLVDEAAIASDRAEVLDLTEGDAALAATIARVAGVAEVPERLRVMVIGDSTSYGVAVELDRQAGDQLQVVWAGRNNCPLVPVDEVFWWDGVSFPSDHCPRADGLWAEVAAELRPDVILAVASLPEQARQRYPGDPDLHEPGDAAYVAAHDEAMAALQAVAAEHGALVLLTDAPAITVGGFAESELARPERLAGWNDQLARWDRQWQSVAVIPWAEPLLAAEVGAGRSLRGDGVHLDPEPLAVLVRDYLAPTIVELTGRLRAELAASGCLVSAPERRRLDLAACATW